jgi:hypothetical protein
MSNLRDAAQQALEALDWYAECAMVSDKASDAASALRAALEQPNECHWLQDGDEDSGTYMASCNQRYFSVVDGTPKDNHMEHCCYCGKPLVEVPIEPEDDHE